MTVKELIEKLKKLDQDKEIYYCDKLGYSEEILGINQNCIFKFKCKEAWSDYKIFYEEGYDNYEMRKETGEIVEYKETYLIK